jgi:hypothetical protein
MSKPTEAELNRALEVAAKMRESGNDPDYIAKALLNHHYRLGLLEEINKAVVHYLHSGLAEREHAVLLKTLDKLRKAEERTAGSEHTDIGLS